jgi:hypothetical protein
MFSETEIAASAAVEQKPRPQPGFKFTSNACREGQAGAFT